MTYQGLIKNGVVVLESGVVLPEGEHVEVRLTNGGRALPPASGPTLFERFKSVVGKAEGLPSDLAVNHDHYIHGAPKGIDQE
jgi:hypothetical protein